MPAARSVICVNCGHRFRENPQENKSGKKKKDAEAPRISPLELRMRLPVSDRNADIQVSSALSSGLNYVE